MISDFHYMNEELITHLNRVYELQTTFIKKTGISKSDAMKIWARWLITHRSLLAQTNMYLPSDNTFDIQFIIELINAGVEKSRAEDIHKELLRECALVNATYKHIGTAEEGGIHGDTSVEIACVKTNTVMVCSNIRQTIPTRLYKKMYRSLSMPTAFKNSYILLCATLYNILDGKGLQWAVPPAVMNIFQRDLGCYTELFASPMNVYNEHYYSLFDIDKHFGSKGNFFTAPDLDFKSGTFQVNPPFIDYMFTKTTKRILKLLASAAAAKRDLTFIYIMPEWKDFNTFNMVADNRFCVKHLHLAPLLHYYYQYSNDSYIQARFGSYIFFLSTNNECCTASLEHDIYTAFLGGLGK